MTYACLSFSIFFTLYIAVSVNAQAGKNLVVQSQSTSLAQDPIVPVVAESASVSVIPGPLKEERMAMLVEIQEAKDSGVGIQNYSAAFLDLENMVEKGVSRDTIQGRLSAIKLALDEQLLRQKPQFFLSNKENLIAHRKPEKLMPLEKARLYMLSYLVAKSLRIKENVLGHSVWRKYGAYYQFICNLPCSYSLSIG